MRGWGRSLGCSVSTKDCAVESGKLPRVEEALTEVGTVTGASPSPWSCTTETSATPGAEGIGLSSGSLPSSRICRMIVTIHLL